MYIVGVDDISLCFLLFVTFCQNTATLTDIIIVSSWQLIGLDLCMPSLPLTFPYLFANEFAFIGIPLPPAKQPGESIYTYSPRFNIKGEKQNDFNGNKQETRARSVARLLVRQQAKK